jgi:hypothetical protein
MAPGWLLAWWRHIAPDNALLRAIEIRDGAELVGLAPFLRRHRASAVESTTGCWASTSGLP